jgi:SPP1 gp7 family putative phage head morphogenesis protein
MGRALETEMRSAPTGKLLSQRLEEVAGLITSLPIDAAERVHALTMRSLSTGARPEQIADEIERSGHVTRSRADLIARTEVARTASLLVQTRAEHVGSGGYVWRTTGDRRVRDDHKHLAGRYFSWDDPPIADKRSGTRAHAGQIWNCRCYPEPVIPDEGELVIPNRRAAA